MGCHARAQADWGEKKKENTAWGLLGKNSGTSISHADLADFILDQPTDDAHPRRSGQLLVAGVGAKPRDGVAVP